MKQNEISAVWGFIRYGYTWIDCGDAMFHLSRDIHDKLELHILGESSHWEDTASFWAGNDGDKYNLSVQDPKTFLVTLQKVVPHERP